MKNKKLLIILILIALIIAALLDLKFEGLFYKMLPEPVQTWAWDVFN
ncbi:hypothetical protein ACOQFO_01575 [Ureibacillus sp. MALMAid1270]